MIITKGAAGRIKEKIMALNAYKGWKEETGIRQGGGGGRKKRQKKERILSNP